MKKQSILLLFAAGLWMTSCGDEGTTSSSETEVTIQDGNSDASGQSGISMQPTTPGPEFPGATLGIKDLKAKAIEGTDSVEVAIHFDVTNYELKSQTDDAKDRTCSNSAEGQHIHFILNNGPYVALYEPSHTFKVAKNSEHTLLSFLSRSYHLSLKNKEAYQLVSFKIDGEGNLDKVDNPSGPMLFYSRPKGTYIGEEAKDILLDFYLVNVDLDKDDLRVIPIANGEVLDEISVWQPYIIKGLPMGKNEITLKLAKKDGSGADNSKFNSVSRTFTLAESEPINN